jgi:hypothetical protein
VAEASGRRLGIRMAVNSLCMDACSNAGQMDRRDVALGGGEAAGSGLGAGRARYVEGLPGICVIADSNKGRSNCSLLESAHTIHHRRQGSMPTASSSQSPTGLPQPMGRVGRSGAAPGVL